MGYLQHCFPTTRHEQYMDENGNTLSRPVLDAAGNPVEDPEAIRMRDELMDMVGTLRIPESPLDMVINHFGHENVSECTGRKERLIYKTQDDGTRKKVLDRRPDSANIAETDAFQGGKKKIMVFSDAGGTGRSYHADKNATNQKQRVHYMLQPGWRADNAVQGLGRTHRTNQAIAPTYKLVEIEQLKAQKRFISTIARRLDQLGALTRGQRQAGGGGLFSAADNLESPEARNALRVFFGDLKAGRIEGLSHSEVMKQLGFTPKEDEGKSSSKQKLPDAPPMGQFLNRLLSLRVEMQNKVFDAYERRLKDTVEQAVREGTLDTGVENFPADNITRKEEKSIHKDPRTGAEAKLLVTIARKKMEKTPFSWTRQGTLPLQYVRDTKNGSVWAVYKHTDKTDAKTGTVTSQYKLEGPTGTKYKPTYEIDTGGYGGRTYDRLEQEEAQKLWTEQHDKAPSHYETTEHFVTGALLPIWDRIPGGDKPKIYRLATSDGQTAVGRHIPSKLVETLFKNFGLQQNKPRVSAEAAHAHLSKGGGSAMLANGWKLKSALVGGERRIEVLNIGPAHMKEVEQDGVIKERVGYTTRFFVPVGEDGAKVLQRITKTRPITDLMDREGNPVEPLQYARRVTRIAESVRNGNMSPSEGRAMLQPARPVSLSPMEIAAATSSGRIKPGEARELLARLAL
jgi:hypothetical protein